MESASNVQASSGDYHLNITTETAREFRGMMRNFLAGTECEVVALIERSGAVIVNELKPNAAKAAPDPDSLGVLVAGLFATTQMIAGQLGEPSSPEVLCHGEECHLLVHPVSDEFALLAAFRDGVAVGVVRLHAKQVAEGMLGHLGQIMRSRSTYSPPNEAVAESTEGPFLQYN
tara:strand:- start:4291 stop:4812 length:522 start_codon:yes stop_codon:yes gene_type:complete